MFDDTLPAAATRDNPGCSTVNDVGTGTNHEEPKKLQAFSFNLKRHRTTSANRNFSAELSSDLPARHRSVRDPLPIPPLYRQKTKSKKKGPG